MTQKHGDREATQHLLKHPNFDSTKIKVDPARPLTDIPDPAPNAQGDFTSYFGDSYDDYGKGYAEGDDDSYDKGYDKSYYELLPKPPLVNQSELSKWQLIASTSLKEQLEFLTAAQLIAIPEAFYEPQQSPPLIADFDPSSIIDLADIDRALQKFPKLSRFGMVDQTQTPAQVSPRSPSLQAIIKRFDKDELLNSDFAEDWQVILQPELFESKALATKDSLALDILPCSLALHVLSLQSRRKTINRGLNADQICQFARSFVLSQAVKFPAKRDYFRQIRLFSGHIIVAAILLGMEIEVARDGACYFNLSSRASLVSRYANLSDYAINGWSI